MVCLQSPPLNMHMWFVCRQRLFYMCTWSACNPLPASMHMSAAASWISAGGSTGAATAHSGSYCKQPDSFHLAAGMCMLFVPASCVWVVTSRWLGGQIHPPVPCRTRVPHASHFCRIAPRERGGPPDSHHCPKCTAAARVHHPLKMPPCHCSHA